MIALLQRVSEASVLVNENSSDNGGQGEITGAIGAGILALVAIEKGDTKAQADRLLQRILAYRMFDDEDGRMNLNLIQKKPLKRATHGSFGQWQPSLASLAVTSLFPNSQASQVVDFSAFSI